MTTLDAAIRNLRSPLSEDQLRPLDPGCKTAQFGQPLSERELSRLSAFLRGYPDVKLRVYGHGTVGDLEFLEAFPTLRHVQIEVWTLTDFAGLRHLPPDLESLGLGATKTKRISLHAIDRFTRLKSLWLEGHAKDFDVVGGKSSLEELSLRSITLPNLRSLATLTNLRILELKLGGTVNLTGLADLHGVEYLEFFLVRDLSDLSPVAEMPNLRFLFLQALRQVTRLPSFARSSALRRVHLETMKGLHDLTPLVAAPLLEELLLIDMGHTSPDILKPFVRHPRLRAMAAGFGSDRKNRAAREMLDLPEPGPAGPDSFSQL